METNVTELWETISIDGKITRYAVSSFGRIRNNKTGRILRPTYESRGYYRACLSNGRSKDYTKVYVHRLILTCFRVSNPKNKSDVNHINGNPSDNRIENLEWATRLENIRHALRTGLSAKRMKNVFLTGEKILEIRKKYTDSVKGKRGELEKLRLEYGLTMGHLQKIVYRGIWKHV